MKHFKIDLKDEGQDLLFFIIDEEGIVVKAGPFHNDLYKGAYIPYDCIGDTENDKSALFGVGLLCPIDHPNADLNQTWLKYKVESITEYDLQSKLKDIMKNLEHVGEESEKFWSNLKNNTKS